MKTLHKSIKGMAESLAWKVLELANHSGSKGVREGLQMNIEDMLLYYLDFRKSFISSEDVSAYLFKEMVSIEDRRPSVLGVKVGPDVREIVRKAEPYYRKIITNILKEKDAYLDIYRTR